MTDAYLGLGSNLGERLAHLQSALDALRARPDLEVVAISSVYETTPVGGPSQPDYLNAVVALRTNLNARALLQVAQALERAAHRVRTQRWGPRTLDVDVLVVGDERVDDPDLVVPHPRMAKRGFVLAPLADVAPERAPAPEGGWSGVVRTELHLR